MTEEAASGLSSDAAASAGLLPVSRMLLVSLPDELLYEAVPMDLPSLRASALGAL